MGNKIDLNHLEGLPNQCGLNIQAIYHSLKTAEKKAVDYIIANSQKIKDISTDQFAHEAGCSKATVVRVSQRLGYKGFNGLKSDFLKNSRGKDFLEYEDITRSDDPVTVMEKVFDSSIKSIKDTLKMIDRKEFLKALEAMLSAKKIVFSGIGDASLVALEAYQRFTRIGIECYADMDPDIQLLKSSQLKKGDVFFAISYSGRSSPVIECARIASRSGATTIALTNYPVSHLAKRSDIVLQTAVFTKYLTGEVISKRLTELLVIESLYTNYILKKFKETQEEIEKSHHTLKANKT